MVHTCTSRERVVSTSTNLPNTDSKLKNSSSSFRISSTQSCLRVIVSRSHGGCSIVDLRFEIWKIHSCNFITVALDAACCAFIIQFLSRALINSNLCHYCPIFVEIADFRPHWTMTYKLPPPWHVLNWCDTGSGHPRQHTFFFLSF